MDRMLKGLIGFWLYGIIIFFPNLIYGKEIQEDQLKAVFVYNFAHFVTYPEFTEDAQTPFTFCIFDEGLFQKALDLTIEDQLINGKMPIVINLDHSQSLDTCKIIYIPKTEQTFYAEILAKTRNKPILTVSDIKDFASNGGMIEFIRKRNKINLKINNQNALQSGLIIKANLLSISTLVEP